MYIQIHFELCKCEDQADFVGKAKGEADKALAIDYGSLLDITAAPVTPAAGKTPSKKASFRGEVPPNMVPPTIPVVNDELDRMRPMDQYVKPLSYSLGLRLSVYDAPEDVEAQVILLLQQAKESSSMSVKTDILSRVSSAMNELINPSETKKRNRNTGDSTQESNRGSSPLLPVSLQDIEGVLNTPRTIDLNDNNDTSAAAHTCNQFTVMSQKRAKIMMDIARLAQEPAQRNDTNSSLITQKAAMYVLPPLWDSKDTFHRELVDNQIEMHFHLIGSLVDQLATLWIEPEMEVFIYTHT
jgi:hypothetical protein